LRSSSFMARHSTSLRGGAKTRSWPKWERVATIAPLLWLSAIPWKSMENALRLAVRWVSLHTGVPAIVVAALLLVVGYRVLKKSARFMVEVALVVALLIAATHAGWLRW
jgi:hypothetical protein